MLWTAKGTNNYKHKSHAHDMHELFFCLNDNGIQNAGGKSCKFTKGRAFLLYSGITHNLEHSKEKPGEFVFFCFDPNHFLELGMENLHKQLIRAQKEELFFSGTDAEYLENNLRTALLLHNELNSNMHLSSELANSLLAVLLITFFRSIKSQASELCESQDEKRLKKLCAAVIANLATKLTLDQVASKAAMSRAKFTRKFKSCTGMSFCEFLVDCRLKKASRLLSEKSMSVSEAAFKSGFSNLGYFHRAFKNKFGATPYRVKKMYSANKYPKFLKLS